jgi:hypothetical protein
MMARTGHSMSPNGHNGYGYGRQREPEAPKTFSPQWVSVVILILAQIAGMFYYSGQLNQRVASLEREQGDMRQEIRGLIELTRKEK